MNPLRRYFTTPARQWLEDRKVVRQGQQQLATYGQAYYGFWGLGPMEQRWFYRFLQRPAFAHLPQSHRLSFFSVFGRRRLLAMADQKAPKIFFTGENLANYPTWQDHALNEVDLALGFDHLQADNYLRFPLWLLDIFDPLAHLITIQDRLAALNAAAANFTQRTGFATLVARHDNNGIRGEIADLLARNGQVDYPGTFRQNTAANLVPSYSDKLTFLGGYQFNICPENSNATGYVTEKIWHAIEAGCIPVYWGSNNQPEPDILRADAFLSYTPADPEALSREVAALLQSPTSLTDFAQQDRFHPQAAETIYLYYQRLEAALLAILS